MELFPPIPPYPGLHPIVVHFPVALLLVAPAFVLLGLLWRGQARAMFVAATLLLVAGTASAFLAASTGEASAEATEGAGAAVRAAVDRHEELAELARNLFIGIAAAALALTGLYWRVHARVRRRWVWCAGLLFLAAHGGAALVLANAAHSGGLLVHELGVHAPLGPGGGISSQAPPAEDDD